MNTQCRKCGRALKNPASQATGYGPVCAAKVADQWEPQGNGQSARYVPCTIRDGFVGARQGGGIVVNVVRNGTQRPLVHRSLHSPSGFEWGYGGSGPADLAYSILYEAAGPTVAQKLYQSFKWDFVAGMKFERWELDINDVLGWVNEKTKGEGTV